MEIHQKCPREFTQKCPQKFTPKENFSWTKVSMRIHPFCPRKFTLYVHKKSATLGNLYELYPCLYTYLLWLQHFHFEWKATLQGTENSKTEDILIN